MRHGAEERQDGDRQGRTVECGQMEDGKEKKKTELTDKKKQWIK